MREIVQRKDERGEKGSMGLCPWQVIKKVWRSGWSLAADQMPRYADPLRCTHSPLIFDFLGLGCALMAKNLIVFPVAGGCFVKEFQGRKAEEWLERGRE